MARPRERDGILPSDSDKNRILKNIILAMRKLDSENPVSEIRLKSIFSLLLCELFADRMGPAIEELDGQE